MRKGTIAIGLIMMLSWPAAVKAEWIAMHLPLAQRGFEGIQKRRGVTVYKHRTSKVIHIAAEGRIPAPPASVQRALLDYKGQVNRIARLSKSRVLRRSEDSLFVYQRLNLPVISDRDFVLYVKWGSQKGFRWVAFRAQRNVKPRSPSGVVRVNLHEGSWQLKPMEGGRSTWLRFQVKIDMGGWLPMWLAKSGAGKEIPDLFGAICQMLSESERGKRSCS